MHPPSELRRYWHLVLACAVGVGCSAIALPFYTIGVLVEPFQAAFGWSRTDIQTAILFSSGCGALSAPIIGFLIDRYGARALAIPGVLGLALAFFAGSFITPALWSLYLVYGAISLLGAGTNPTTWTRAIAGTFHQQRGLALGLALTGTGACAIFAPQYALWLRDSYGWQAVFYGLSALTLCLALPITVLAFKEQRNSPGAPTPQQQWGIPLAQAIKSYRFWVLLGSIFIIYLAISGIIPNLIPALTDRGFTPSEATNVASTIGISLVFGRLLIGYLVDKFWAPMIAAIATSLPVAACLILLTTTDVTEATFAAILIGIAAGAELDLLAFFTAKYFGLRHYAKLYGVFYIALALAGGGAPTLFAISYDMYGSYEASFIIAAVLFALGTLLVLCLGRYPEEEASDPI